MARSTMPPKRGASSPAESGRPDPHRRSVQPLYLRLLSSRGRPCDEVLTVPASGSGTGLSAALELGGERLSEARWRAANQCRIAWQADPEGRGGWQLSNASRTFACTLNGKRVGGAAAVGIAPGDTLALGQLRFVVEAADAGESAFDLRDLALPAHPGQAGVLHDDTFGVLDIQGAKARPLADPLAGLLGEASAAGTLRQSTRSASSQHRPTDSETNPHADRATRLLTGLNQEFERVVRDPTQLSGRADWAGAVKSGEQRSAAMDEVIRDGSVFLLVGDVLDRRSPIESLIDGFDASDRPTLCDAPENPDVLRLFAPEVAHGAPAVPSLTRREHHEFSPDSHVQMGGAREVAD